MTGIPQVYATSLKVQTVTAGKKKHTVLEPILEEGEDEDSENYEQVFEAVFSGKKSRWYCRA
jgi:hypothetical protein